MFQIHPFIFCLSVLKVQNVKSFMHTSLSFLLNTEETLKIFVITVCAYDMWEVPVCGGRRTPLWNWFSSFTFM